MRFKKVDATSVLTADLHTLRYGYDKLARLRSADYAYNDSPAASPFRQYAYSFDGAGNRTQQVATVSGTPTTTEYEYNAGNQLYRQRVNAGAWTNLTYDNNGNLTHDGSNSYTWDRANRLLSMGGSSYAYDGLGNRHKQTIAGNATNYLLDLQPGLTVVLAQTTGANTDRFLHALEGIHAQKDAANNWEYMEQDGLGSVRGMVSSGLSILETRLGDPFGNAIASTGSSQTPFGFTGEMSDSNELLFLRARYYRPSIGTFTALDPFEGIWEETSSINGYDYVGGNPLNRVDPNGQSWLGDIISRLAEFFSDARGIFDEQCPSYPCNLMIGRDPVLFAKARCLPTGLDALSIKVGALPLPDSPGYYPPPSIVPRREPTIIDALIAILMILIIVLTFPYPASNPKKKNEEEKLNWVVRGGEAKPESLITGYKESRRIPGNYGFSVNYLPGSGKSPEELACENPLPNTKISFAKDTDLMAAAVKNGYIIGFTLFEGVHHNLNLYTADGTIVKEMSNTLAIALSETLQQNRITNPCKRE